MEFAWTTLPTLELLQISIAYCRDHENIAFASFYIINTETQSKQHGSNIMSFYFISVNFQRPKFRL